MDGNENNKSMEALPDEALEKVSGGGLSWGGRVLPDPLEDIFAEKCHKCGKKPGRQYTLYYPTPIGPRIETCCDDCAELFRQTYGGKAIPVD